MERPVYRKWINHEELSEHYLLIHPSGIMLEITFQPDSYRGQKVIVYQTTRSHEFNPTVFLKHKEVCSKNEWNDATRKVIDYTKGKMLPKSASRSKQKGMLKGKKLVSAD